MFGMDLLRERERNPENPGGFITAIANTNARSSNGMGYARRIPGKYESENSKKGDVIAPFNTRIQGSLAGYEHGSMVYVAVGMVPGNKVHNPYGLRFKSGEG
jgi:hypothetical protein